MSEVDDWREKKIAEYEVEKAELDRVRIEKKAFSKSIRDAGLEEEDVADVLNTLEFVLSGKSNDYCCKLLRFVLGEYIDKTKEVCSECNGVGSVGGCKECGEVEMCNCDGSWHKAGIGCI